MCPKNKTDKTCFLLVEDQSKFDVFKRILKVRKTD